MKKINSFNNSKEDLINDKNQMIGSIFVNGWFETYQIINRGNLYYNGA